MSQEVNSWGGFEKQFHVIIDPFALVKFGQKWTPKTGQCVKCIS